MDPNIIEVRRRDLIEQYVGYSYNNITNFLLANLDKTIIVIDNLVIGPYDSFGEEIEKAIKDFSISNPCKIKYNNRPNNNY